MNIPLLINKAIKKEPPEELLKFCGEYYSPYYNLMFLLAEEIGTGTLVELGVHKGRGLFALASASLANTVIGFDTVREKEIKTLESKFENILFINRPSLPPPVGFKLWGIDLLHIDTEHSYAMAQAEFEAYQPYLKRGAVVLFDDLHAERNGVRKFFRSLSYKKWERDELHPTCGYGILLYQEDK